MPPWRVISPGRPAPMRWQREFARALSRARITGGTTMETAGGRRWPACAESNSEEVEMQVKVFSGEAEKVERAINRWCDDGGRRNVLSMVALHVPDGVGVMFVFN